MDFSRPNKLHAYLQGLLKFQTDHGDLPSPGKVSDAESVFQYAMESEYNMKQKGLLKSWAKNMASKTSTQKLP